VVSTAGTPHLFYFGHPELKVGTYRLCEAGGVLAWLLTVKSGSHTRAIMLLYTKKANNVCSVAQIAPSDCTDAGGQACARQLK